MGPKKVDLNTIIQSGTTSPVKEVKKKLHGRPKRKDQGEELSSQSEIEEPGKRNLLPTSKPKTSRLFTRSSAHDDMIFDDEIFDDEIFDDEIVCSERRTKKVTMRGVY